MRPLFLALVVPLAVACATTEPPLGGTTTTTSTGSSASGSGGTATGGKFSGVAALTNCDPAPSAQSAAVSAAASGNTALGLNLLTQLSSQAGSGNLFFSPLSLTAALAMAYAGANGDTATQMSEVLQFGAPSATYAPGFGALDCQLASDGNAGDGGQLDLANALFGQVDAGFEPAFLSALSNDYGAPLQTVDFVDDPSAALSTINGWVSQQTEGLIPSLLQSSDITPDLRLILADAIYFHGLWTQFDAFDPSRTTDGGFQVDAQTTVQVPMMSNYGAMALGYYAGSSYAIAELPFQSKIAFDVILPTAVDGLPAVAAALDANSLTSALGQLSQTSVDIVLPKLALDTKLDLVPTFEALGLQLPFEFEAADFSGIDGQKDLFIKLIKHQAVLQVDEAGATAAAATAIGVTDGAVIGGGPVSFVVDHPFLLLVRDLPTGTILFIGLVQNPTQS